MVAQVQASDPGYGGTCNSAPSSSIFLAALPSAARQGGGDRAALVKEAAARPTPRMKDGRPDLSGNWSNPPVPVAPANFVNLPLVRSADGKTLTVLDRDAPELDALDQPRFKARVADQSRRPPYKKEFVAKQRELMTMHAWSETGSTR